MRLGQQTKVNEIVEEQGVRRNHAKNCLGLGKPVLEQQSEGETGSKSELTWL